MNGLKLSLIRAATALVLVLAAAAAIGAPQKW
jgi:hypothetical protein